MPCDGVLCKFMSYGTDSAGIAHPLACCAENECNYRCVLCRHPFLDTRELDEEHQVCGACNQEMYDEYREMLTVEGHELVLQEALDHDHNITD